MSRVVVHDGPPTKEELAVLGVIDLLQETRYGMTALEDIEARVGQAFGRSALRGALAFLEKADLIKASYAAALEHGGGRRKLFSFTSRAQKAIGA